MKLLKFYSPGCQPCKGLSMTIDGAKSDGLITIPVEPINIEEDIDTALQYGVRAVPTLVLVDEDGNEIKKSVGLLSQSQILDFLIVQ